MFCSSSALRAKATRFTPEWWNSAVFVCHSLCHVPRVVPNSAVSHNKCNRIEGQLQSFWMPNHRRPQQPTKQRTNHHHRPFSTVVRARPDEEERTTVIPFLLADIGEGIHEVELLQWNVQVGDTVQQFDLICQVQSDKATVEITSRFDGTIVELAGKVGDMIQVGTPMVFLETTATHPEDSRSEAHSAPGQTRDVPSMTAMTMMDENTKIVDDDDMFLPGQVPTTSTSRQLANDVKIQTSPAVRKMCKEKAIDPSIIPATGPQGRLLKADVLAFVNGKQPSIIRQPQASVVEISPTQNIEEQIVELRGYTRAMAKAMTQSLEIPHMCLGDEVDVTRLLVIRNEINQSTMSSTKLSLLAFVIKSCSVALKDFPILNAAQHTETSIRMQSQHQIGVAMDTPRGLVVPVLGDCSILSISEIQERMDVLKESREDIALDATRPTFTLSNIGALGAGLSLQPVLVPPQLAMGAIGRLQRLPRFGTNDQVIASSILPMTWTADHRYVDGAQLARFHVRVQQLLSNPYEMMVHMK